MNFFLALWPGRVLWAVLRGRPLLLPVRPLIASFVVIYCIASEGGVDGRPVPFTRSIEPDDGAQHHALDRRSACASGHADHHYPAAGAQSSSRPAAAVSGAAAEIDRQLARNHGRRRAAMERPANHARGVAI